MSPITQDGRQCIFAGAAMKHRNPKDLVLAIGYVKPENNHWVAVCINMCLVGQGKTPVQALDSLMDSVTSYIQFVRQRYPKDWRSRMECEPPGEFIRDFRRIKDGIDQVFSVEEEKAAGRSPSHTWSPTDFQRKSVKPGYSFVQPVAASHSKATV